MILKPVYPVFLLIKNQTDESALQMVMLSLW